jgi:predicted FMN-binding regulatory protein PaiB
VRGLTSICEQSDRRKGAYRLSPEDPRIDRLINFIVGFEIDIEELIGRFKLSQDRTASDSRLAAIELARHSEAGARSLIEDVLGYRL